MLKGVRFGWRMNWSRISSRDRMQRQGIEGVKGKTPLGGQPPKARRNLSKAELREEATAAFLAWRAGRAAKNKYRVINRSQLERALPATILPWSDGASPTAERKVGRREVCASLHPPGFDTRQNAVQEHGT
jgi:hypothetical protein